MRTTAHLALGLACCIPASAQDFSGNLLPSALPAPPELAGSCLPGPGNPALEPEIRVDFPPLGREFTLPPLTVGPNTAPPCVLPPPPPQRPPAPDIFGYSAIPVGPRSVRSEWLAASYPSLAGVPGPWSELLEQASRATGGEPIEMVNRWVNWHVRYVDDRGGDHWASATETLTSGIGDCEDFAIAKMALLAQLGIPAKDIYFILARERTRPIDHAVLAVRRGGTTYVLDNVTDMLLPDSKITDYVPVLSYNGIFAWTYGARNGPGPVATSGRPPDTATP